MPGENDVCYHALIEITHRSDSIIAKILPGAYVNAWTYAASEPEARDAIECEAIERLFADTVDFCDFGPGDPHDTGIQAAELQTSFVESRVIFGTPIGWRRRKWWQFWRSADRNR